MAPEPEPAYTASLDQGLMAFKDIAKMHATYYKALLENGVPNKVARNALVHVVYVQVSQMFACRHKDQENGY